MEASYTTQCSRCGVSLGGPCVPGAFCVQCSHNICDWCQKPAGPGGLVEWPLMEWSDFYEDYVPTGRFEHICGVCAVNHVAHVWA